MGEPIRRQVRGGDTPPPPSNGIAAKNGARAELKIDIGRHGVGDKMASRAEMLLCRRGNAVRFKQGAGRRACMVKMENGKPCPPSDFSGAFRYLPIPYPDRAGVSLAIHVGYGKPGR